MLRILHINGAVDILLSLKDDADALKGTSSFAALVARSRLIEASILSE